jgi:phosphatidylglycerophosphatase A
VATFLSTGLGTGLSPFAPGTAGSALSLVLAWLLARSLLTNAPSMTAAVGLLMSGFLLFRMFDVWKPGVI